MNLVSKTIDSPVGKLKLVASEKALVAVLWENDDKSRVRIGESVKSLTNRVLIETERQLGQYFAGKRRYFKVPLDLRGTPFQRNVWEALLAIPFGETGGMANWLGVWGIPRRPEPLAPRPGGIRYPSSCHAIA